MIDTDVRERWLLDMRDDGVEIAHDLIEPNSHPDASENDDCVFHVVSAIEDFEGFGLGVRMTLSEYGTVSFSCLWNQYEVLHQEPLLERCPIFRTFHETEPKERYRLVFAVSDIGSVFPLKSMILHTALERGFSRFESIDVISPTCHIRARAELNRHLPVGLANLTSFTVPTNNRQIMANGYTAALGGSTPSELAGFSDMWKRENYTPREIDERLRSLPRRPRPSPSPDEPGSRRFL